MFDVVQRTRRAVYLGGSIPLLTLYNVHRVLWRIHQEMILVVKSQVNNPILLLNYILSATA